MKLHFMIILNVLLSMKMINLDACVGSWCVCGGAPGLTPVPKGIIKQG